MGRPYRGGSYAYHPEDEEPERKQPLLLDEDFARDVEKARQLQRRLCQRDEWARRKAEALTQGWVNPDVLLAAQDADDIPPDPYARLREFLRDVPYEPERGPTAEARAKMSAAQRLRWERDQALGIGLPAIQSARRRAAPGSA